MSKQKRAAVYSRVSTDEQAKHGLSLGVQEATCRAAAEADGCVVGDTDVYVDDGYSGRSIKRPAYKELLSRLHEYDVIYAIRLDRYSRSVRDVFALLDECSKRDVLLKAVYSKIDMSSAMGRAMVGVSAVFAALESELTQERVLESMQEAAEQGRNISTVPFGYMLPAPKATIIPDPQTAHTVKRIFADYAEGKSIISICRDLNDAGVKAVRADAWSTAAIRVILKCKTYIGKIAHNGKVYVGRHEAIIDDETFARCQLRLATNARISPRARNGSLSPLIYCGYCGKHLHVSATRPNVRIYSCAANRLSEDRHPAISIRDYIIEGYIWLLVEEMLSDGGEAEFGKAMAVGPVGDGACAILRAEKQGLEERIRYNLRAAREADLPMHLLADENRPLQNRLAEVEIEIRQAVENGSRTRGQIDVADGLTALRSQGYEEQRVYLSNMLRRVEVFADRIVFYSTVPNAKPFGIERQRFNGTQEKTLVLRRC